MSVFLARARRRGGGAYGVVDARIIVDVREVEPDAVMALTNMPMSCNTGLAG